MTKKLLLLSLIFFLLISIYGCRKVYSDLSDYQYYIEKIPNANDFMPDLSTLPESHLISVYYYEHLGQSLNLVITYTAVTYLSARDSIINSYTFLDNPLVENDYFLIPEVEFQYLTFTIKVVNDNYFNYPEFFGMIGYSDSTYQIAFLYFCDNSLDRLSNNPGRMSRFIESEFRFGDN